MRRFGRTLIGLAIARASAGLAILIVFKPGSSEASLWCLIGFVAALLTDEVDGWLARTYSTPNTVGYLQDAVSDKLLHVGALLALSQEFQWLAITLWCVIARELIILSVRVVHPNVNTLLKRYKSISLIYAGMIRVGIVGLFVTVYAGQPNAPYLLVAALYSVLNCGAAFGLIALIFIIRSMPKSGKP